MSLTETSTDPADETEGAFSQVLRRRTADVHDSAEHSPLMAALLDGTVERSDYAQLVAQLYYVYRALEEGADALAGDEVAAPFLFRELDRVPAFESDLEVLIGAHWREVIAPLPSTAAYADRIAEVAATWPGGYVAHHYTRYMGDLSGGIFIGGVVRRTYDLTETHGASIYTFEEIPSPKAFKTRYRELLDAAPWDAAEHETIVGEIVDAYGRNTTLFRDVWAAIAPPTVEN